MSLDVDLAGLREPQVVSLERLRDIVCNVRIVGGKHNLSARLRALHVHRYREKIPAIVPEAEHAVRAAAGRLVVTPDTALGRRQLLLRSEFAPAQKLGIDRIYELVKRHLLHLLGGKIAQSERALERRPHFLEPGFELLVKALLGDELLAPVADHRRERLVADLRVATVKIRIRTFWVLRQALYLFVVIALGDKIHALLP